MDSGSLGVDDPLGDAFTIELCQFIDEMMVLDENWAQFSGGHGVLVVVNGNSLGGGHLLRHGLLKLYHRFKHCCF
jgi:hypothetical protein